MSIILVACPSDSFLASSCSEIKVIWGQERTGNFFENFFLGHTLKLPGALSITYSCNVSDISNKRNTSCSIVSGIKVSFFDFGV